MLSVALDRADAQRLGDNMQAVWHADILPKVTELTAWGLTLIDSLGRDEVIGLFGPDVMQDAQFLTGTFNHIWPVAYELDVGTAVLIPWYDDREGGQHLAAIRREGIPEGAELAGWPVVVAVVGLAIGGAYVLVKYWERDLAQIAKDTQGIRTTAQARIMQNAEAIRASDPAAYAKIIDAMAKAELVGANAAQDPNTWLQKALTQVGQAAKTAAQFSPLMILAFLWFMSGDRRRRAA